MPAYATVFEAEQYFQERLHERAWSQSSGADKEKSLLAATRIIDRLNYKGFKNTVYVAIQADEDLLVNYQMGCPDALETIRTAEAAQENEFPRGADTAVPEDIKVACYEIAYSLLDGVDPDLELENLSINNHGIGNVRASFNRTMEPIEHYINGIPSATAWRYLKPFLRDGDHIKFYRVS